MKLTYIQQSGSPPVGDGGDQYTGLDRFGRVVDQRWMKASSGADLERVKYGYDGQNRRTLKVTGTTTRHYYYSSSWQVLEERLNAKKVADRQYVWGLLGLDNLVLRDRGSERFYSLQDVFSCTAIADITGTIQERYGYDAFGLSRVMDADFNVLPASNYDWETRYDNYRFDDESNFFQVRNRYLHPNLGRWITRDPIENKDGMNLYAYINNNSINGVDYYGLEKITHESGPGKSACGSWKNVWKIYPQVTGTFWIVQRVSGNYSAKDCDGKNIHEYPPDWMEAWKVTVPKPGYFKDDDVFSGISNSSGNANTNVSSAIYPDKPPYSIDIPKWTYSGSYPISGAYQTNNPPTWWGKGSLGTATRSTSSTWRCCPKSKNFSTVTYSSK